MWLVPLKEVSRRAESHTLACQELGCKPCAALRARVQVQQPEMGPQVRAKSVTKSLKKPPKSLKKPPNICNTSPLHARVQALLAARGSWAALPRVLLQPGQLLSGAHELLRST